jgi:large subunit ribosomal protein L6
MVRKTISEVIEVPADVSIEITADILKLKKGENELTRRLEYEIKKTDNKLTIGCEKATKKEKKLIKTFVSHIKGMLSGLQKKYLYKLQICSVHFPMNVSVSKDSVIIKNFLGETKDRKAKILPGVNVKVEGDIMSIESCDKEKAGQTAANIEKATKIRNRDRRVFQDGIFITEKEKGARK